MVSPILNSNMYFGTSLRNSSLNNFCFRATAPLSLSFMVVVVLYTGQQLLYSHLTEGTEPIPWILATKRSFSFLSDFILCSEMMKEKINFDHVLKCKNVTYVSSISSSVNLWLSALFFESSASELFVRLNCN